jgi:hypothetical protein
MFKEHQMEKRFWHVIGRIGLAIWELACRRSQIQSSSAPLERPERPVIEIPYRFRFN